MVNQCFEAGTRSDCATGGNGRRPIERTTCAAAWDHSIIVNPRWSAESSFFILVIGWVKFKFSLGDLRNTTQEVL
jgi:hypothetical protein